MAVDLRNNDTALFSAFNDISQNLENRNLKDMKFLLYDSDLPRSKLETVQCGNELFELLLTAKMLSWQLLGDFLALIGRKDLQEKVKTFSQELQVPSMCDSAYDASRIPTPLRKLMYQMAKGMSRKMVEDIKFCEASLSLSDKLEDALDILDYFIKDKPIRSVQEIPEKLKGIPHLTELYEKHCTDDPDWSNASIQFRERFSSLFSEEDVPTFETEYLHAEDLDLQEDKMASTELGRGTFGVINTGK